MSDNNNNYGNGCPRLGEQMSKRILMLHRPPLIDRGIWTTMLRHHPPLPHVRGARSTWARDLACPRRTRLLDSAAGAELPWAGRRLAGSKDDE